jgi:hypothetical protein
MTNLRPKEVSGDGHEAKEEAQEAKEGHVTYQRGGSHAPREALHDLSAPPAPTERLRLAADELERDGRWGGAVDATTALAAWLRAEADRPERGAWDDQVLYLAVDVADHILGEVDR